MTRHEQAEQYLTPSEQEQAWLMLQGKCPHNAGWEYVGHSHNDDCYVCKLCKTDGWY